MNALHREHELYLDFYASMILYTGVFDGICYFLASRNFEKLPQAEAVDTSPS